MGDFGQQLALILVMPMRIPTLMMRIILTMRMMVQQDDTLLVDKLILYVLP
jgi:hypothetical protein